MKTENTSLCAAIDNRGVIAYQIFDKSMKGQDYQSFVCSLVNCLKLGRNTSFDMKVMNNDGLYEGVDDLSEERLKGLVLVMDNARIHHETNVKEVLGNYNVLFLPPYSPHLNPIELWFGQLRKLTKEAHYGTTMQLRKGIVKAIKQVQPGYYTNVYRRLLRVCYEAFNMETLT